MTKLILGTASFGSNYGIKQDGQPDEKEIEKIARVAWDGGIRIIHTSWQYGLPKICEAVFSEFEWIRKEYSNPNYFNLGERLGISVYFSGNEERMVREETSIIQMPVNILSGERCINDYSFLGDELEFHARSVFLQGLLLMEELPAWVNGQARAHIKLFHHICKQEGYEPYEAALGWVLGLGEIDKVIVGVNSARQLQQLLKVSPLNWDYDFSITDEMVLDPRKWPKA